MNLVSLLEIQVVSVVVATVVIRTVSRQVARKKGLPTPRASAPMAVMPRVRQFRMERRVRPAFRVLAGLFVLTIVWAQSSSPEPRPVVILAILELVAILSLAAVGLLIDATLHCTCCGRRMLLESMDFPPFPPPRKQTEALRRGIFQCMYCGQHYDIQRS